MNGNQPHSKSQFGFSTIEILMAMFILLLALTAVISVSFGNQSMIIDSQTNAEALNLAQGLLEKAQADARKDFNLVNPYTAKSNDNFYDETVTVTHPIKDGHPDYFTKLVTAKVNWTGEFNRNLNVSLSALVTNFNNAVGGDTCSSVLGEWNSDKTKFEYKPEAWKNPEIKNQDSICSRIGADQNCPITDLDAYKNKLYVTVGETDATSTPTFLIYDIDSENHKITFDDLIDNSDYKGGLNAVAVAEDPATQTLYAYVADAGSTTQPLQILKLDDMSWVDTSKTLDISGKALGNSIFYAHGYVYLGLESTGGNGPEFSIVDVHKPATASEVGHWPRTGNLGHAINSIYVRGDYAFLAVAGSDNVIILNISDPTKPEEEAVFNTDGTDDNGGKSAAIVGNTLYLGRTIPVAGTNGDKFYILDAGDPATSTLPIINSYSAVNKSVDGVIVRGKTESNNSAEYPALAFLLTTNYLRVLNVSDNGAMAQWANLSFDGSDGSNDVAGSHDFEPVFDCEGNVFFLGSNDNSDKGYISVISP